METDAQTPADRPAPPSLTPAAPAASPGQPPAKLADTILPRPSHAPDWRTLLAVFAAAVALRAALCGLSLWRGELTLMQFAAIRDGDQYLALIQAWLGNFEPLHALGADTVAYAQRLLLSPLYPALAALAHGGLGLPLAVAALAPNWLFAGFTAALSARVFNDRRVGWAVAILTPSFLLTSVLISTEATCLLFSLLALDLARRERSSHAVLAGIALGLAGLGRPVALFAAMGLFVMALASGRARRGAAIGLVAAAVYALGMLTVQWRFGSVLDSVSAYAQADAAYGSGGLLAAPFTSLLHTPGAYNVPAWKVAYIYAHVAAVLFACAWMLWDIDAASARDGSRRFVIAAALWLWGNTLFVLCVGDRWGFDEFHRFITPALPPLLWALRSLLPGGRRLWGTWLWAPIAVASLGLAYFGLADGFDNVRAPMPASPAAVTQPVVPATPESGPQMNADELR